MEGSSENDQGCTKKTNTWNYFNMSTMSDCMFIITCKICSHTCTSQTDPSVNGTTNMNRHLRKHNLSKEESDTHPYAPWDQGMVWEKLCAAIIKHNYPFTYVEHEGTREVHKF